MGKNKGSYSAKHQHEDGFSSWINDNEDLWQIFKQPYDFEKIFLQLPYQRQLEFLKVMKNIQSSHFSLTPRNQAALQYAVGEFFEKIQWMTDSSYEEGEGFFPLADDEKKLLRMECYGSIDARKPHQLSNCYKFFINSNKRGLPKHKLKEYDLAASPMWRVFRQFESFRSIEPKIKKYLYKTNINPEVLKVMSVSDFCDVIYKTFSPTVSQDKVRFLEKPLKNKFVMDFMKQCGSDLYDYLCGKNLDERLAFSLCFAMKRYGVCDPVAITVVDTHFTQRIIKDLQNHDYDVSKYKVGDRIPLPLIYKVFDRDQGSLLMARDENGIPLSKAALPKFEVHHADGVQFANSDSGGKLHHERYLAQANYPNSLMLVESNLHRFYYHGYDSVIRASKNTECYYSRINSNNPFMALINGFSTQDQFICDMEDNQQFRNRAKEDEANVVNYFEMQLERLHNIQQVAAMYRINYSSSSIKQEISEMQSAIGTSDISDDIIKGLSKWMHSVKKNKKIEKKNKFNNGGRE